MSISMYQASVPVFLRALNNLHHVLKAGEAHAKSRNVEDSVMLNTRLIPDMLPLVKQVQIATDMAKNAAARLAGVDPLKFEDNETSFHELYSRIERAIDYIKGFKPEQIDGSETRAITLQMRRGEMHFEGQSYLLHFVIPNVFFHCTTAYDILRSTGTNIGKEDYLGKP
ncbi:DUF1993 domain-containing protein [Dyella mobilis]|uniref:DUF1993 domain-containing protein n=1 Tax=Dyella mobilis TaxID=1849582 RepID=A0ABS2KDD9_9GAMM|nr:DUF1993 domain-containing protein [Dyella mobilis]MBM7129196.1 DUF1993 domain-containing protein [Dyella mobilis]GLQ98490.1 hypothetical protein GCM10007863_29100 [Dyella mobilis]